MLRRLLAPVLLALALLATSGCADAVSPAVRVGDVSISNDDFLDEVTAWFGFVEGRGQPLRQGMPPGGYPLELVGQLAQQRIMFELHNAEFVALGLDLDDDLRDEALAEDFGDLAGAQDAFGEFDDDFAAELIDDLVRQVAVQQELGDGYEDWLQGAFADVDIEVNPRYGTWDAVNGQVVPPEGPIQPASSGA